MKAFMIFQAVEKVYKPIFSPLRKIYYCECVAEFVNFFQFSISLKADVESDPYYCDCVGEKISL